MECSAMSLHMVAAVHGPQSPAIAIVTLVRSAGGHTLFAEHVPHLGAIELATDGTHTEVRRGIPIKGRFSTDGLTVETDRAARRGAYPGVNSYGVHRYPLGRSGSFKGYMYLDRLPTAHYFACILLPRSSGRGNRCH